MAALKDIYFEIKDLGVVNSQREFSSLWGKKPSWCSTSMTRGRKPGLDALVRFHVTLMDLEQNSRIAAAEAQNNDEANEYMAGAEKLFEIKSAIWSEIIEVARECA
jgi:hypothetical protein